jgi:hypothetical protein
MSQPFFERLVEDVFELKLSRVFVYSSFYGFLLIDVGSSIEIDISLLLSLLS